MQDGNKILVNNWKWESHIQNDPISKTVDSKILGEGVSEDQAL